MRNLNRFCTDINDFEGEGIEITVKENRSNRSFLNVGTIVKIVGVDERVEVERIWPVYEQKLYDYRGIIDTAEGKKYIYFNEDDIMQVIT